MELKKFNLEKAKAGEPVITRGGRPVRLICFNIKGTRRPIVGLVDNGELEAVETWDESGAKNPANESFLDLYMAPKKKTIYVNLYNGKRWMEHPTEEIAKQLAAPGAIAVALPVEIEV